jgi:hypothetical protein
MEGRKEGKEGERKERGRECIKAGTHKPNN